MTGFNSDLNKLFQNFKQQQLNTGDKSTLLKEEEDLKKKENLFDVNGDGKFNQNDIDMFIKGNVDGNNEVSKEELTFISKYKDELAKVFKAQKADFKLDGIKYVDGKLASGTICGKYYKNGILFTGENDGKTYVYGDILANGETYVLNDDKVAVVTSKDGRTRKCYDKDGNLYSTILDNNKSEKPGLKKSDTIEFENGKTLSIRNGDTAIINDNQYVVVTSKDGRTRKCYDKDGNLFSTITDNNKSEKPGLKKSDTIEFENGKTLSIRNGDTAIINDNQYVVVTSKDGRTRRCYNKEGNLYTGTVDGITYNAGVAQPSQYNKTVTSDVLTKISDFEIRTEKNYSNDNKLISDYIKICRTTSGTEFLIPATDGLDASKITRVIRNKDGSFTVTADGKNYNFTDYSINTYDKTSGKLKGQAKIKDGKTYSNTLYNDGYTMTCTDYVNGKWTKAESVYDDGCKIKYSKAYNDDGSYSQVDNKYNSSGELIEIGSALYNSSGNRVNRTEFVLGKYVNGKYEGGICNVRENIYEGDKCTCTKRTGYTTDSGEIKYDSQKGLYTCKIKDSSQEKKQYKEYEWLNDEHTASNVTFTTYSNGKETVTKQTCYFGLKDENELEYRYYVGSDGSIEIWHYNSAGIRIKATVTDKDGNQSIVNHDASGQVVSRETCKVDLQKDIIEKYGKDKNGNYLKYINN